MFNVKSRMIDNSCRIPHTHHCALLGAAACKSRSTKATEPTALEPNWGKQDARLRMWSSVSPAFRVTPALHHSDTTRVTPEWYHFDTSVTPVWHHCKTTRVTPVWHHSDTTVTLPALRQCDTTLTPALRQCDTTSDTINVTPEWHQRYTSNQRCTRYTSVIPLLHQRDISQRYTSETSFSVTPVWHH